MGKNKDGNLKNKNDLTNINNSPPEFFAKNGRKNRQKRAVILLSGGIDSSTCLAIARERGFELYALTVDYNQRHRVELEAAKRIAKTFNVARHEVIELNLRQFGGSALTADIDVPKNVDQSDIGDEIPITYVPSRNIIMLTLAVSWAETVGAQHIFIGVNAVDYSGYPDCRPEFITAFQLAVNRGTKAGVEGYGFNIEAPLIKLNKAEIIRLGIDLGVDFSLTHSCYDPVVGRTACGQCESCLLRRKGFSDAGLVDPIR